MNRLISRSLLKPSSLSRWNLQQPKHCSTPAVEDSQVETEQEDSPKINYNKSRLEDKDYKRYHEIPTVLSSLEVDVTPLRNLREEYGKYGAASGIEEKYLWPSKQELQLMKEYEEVKYPLGLHEMIKKAKHEKQDSVQFTINRQKEIIDNMKNLAKWKKAVTDNIQKKENEAKAARDKREKLIEEVRLMFGVRIDPKDDKFQEALAKKELEEKKAEKALKKQQKQQKMLEQLKKIADAERMKQAEGSQSPSSDISQDGSSSKN